MSYGMTLFHLYGCNGAVQVPTGKVLMVSTYDGPSHKTYVLQASFHGSTLVSMQTIKKR